MTVEVSTLARLVLAKQRKQSWWSKLAQNVPSQTQIVRSSQQVVGSGPVSRRRDCHSAAPSSPFSRCFNMDSEGLSSK